MRGKLKTDKYLDHLIVLLVLAHGFYKKLIYMLTYNFAASIIIRVFVLSCDLPCLVLFGRETFQSVAHCVNTPDNLQSVSCPFCSTCLAFPTSRHGELANPRSLLSDRASNNKVKRCERRLTSDHSPITSVNTFRKQRPRVPLFITVICYRVVSGQLIYGLIQRARESKGKIVQNSRAVRAKHDRTLLIAFFLSTLFWALLWYNHYLRGFLDFPGLFGLAPRLINLFAAPNQRKYPWLNFVDIILRASARDLVWMYSAFVNPVIHFVVNRHFQAPIVDALSKLAAIVKRK